MAKQKCSITFVGNDDVIQHINYREEKSVLLGHQDSVYQSRKHKRSDRMAQLAAQTYTPLAAIDSFEKIPESSRKTQPKKTTCTSAVLLGHQDSIAGGTVYQFRKYKRSDRMAQLAAQTYTPLAAIDSFEKIPESSRKTQPKKTTCTSTGKQATPSVSSVTENVQNLHISTCKTTPVLPESDVKYESVYSPEPSRDEDKDDDDVESRHEMSPDDDSDVQTTSSNCYKANMAQEYFEAHSGSAMTSDHTLSRLDKPQMDSQQLNSMLTGMTNNYATEIDKLYQEYQGLFKKWMFNLSNGFNLLFYGLGSKRNLLEKLRSDCLSDWAHIVINGFFPGLTIKSIQNTVSSVMAESDDGDDIFLIIHNIDGVMLRGRKIQSILSSLAQIPKVHIVASIDHINAPLMWDQALSSAFNWLWYDVTTFEPYVEETSYENSFLVQQTGVLALSSLTHVLRSLTPNANGIFNILVQYQLQHKNDGLAITDLYRQCREAFLVNNQLTLNAQLTEFRDHKLIRSCKGIDGIELLSIPVDNATLQEFLKQEEDHTCKS